MRQETEAIVLAELKTNVGKLMPDSSEMTPAQAKALGEASIPYLQRLMALGLNRDIAVAKMRSKLRESIQ